MPPDPTMRDQPDNPDPVGVVGIGLMGLAMAQRLREAGHPVWVRDLRPEREALARAAGCQVADSPAALASHCRLVLVAVVDGAQLQAVVRGPDGLVQARPAPDAVLLCPTVAPDEVAAAAQALALAGIATVDAPMSGGPVRARAGTMSLMLAGAPEVLARHRAVLDCLSNQQVHVGARLGDGARTKLVNNLLAAVNLAGAAQAMALAQRLGLDAATTLATLARSSGHSWIGSDRLQRALAGDETVHAATALLAKDSRLAMAMARQAGSEPSLGAEAARLFAQACSDGLAPADDSRLLAWCLAAGAAGGHHRSDGT